jgi:4-amino-4-deoxy-L-arabinose transferase-like glycosyltransferase
VGNYGPKVKKDQPSLVQDKAKNDDAVPVDKKLINKQRQLTKFLYYLGLGYLGPSVPNDIDTGGLATVAVRDTMSTQIYECEKLTSVLGLWLLPGMYGLLGAVVFQMRAVLNPLIPDPPLERLLIRFALGAMAGVSISWLFGEVPAKSSEVQSLHTTLFGLSFLLGFSIDVFFALLDRTVEMLSNSIVKKDK